MLRLLLILACGVVLASANRDANRLFETLLADYNKLVRPVDNNTDTLVVHFKLKLSQLLDVVRCPFPALLRRPPSARKKPNHDNKRLATTHLDRQETALEPGGLRRRRCPLRALRHHLVTGHRPLQQVGISSILLERLLSVLMVTTR